jgi:hypothetical protein
MEPAQWAYGGSGGSEAEDLIRFQPTAIAELVNPENCSDPFADL